MTYKELMTLKNGTTLLILNNRVITYTKEALTTDYKGEPVYMYGSERISISKLKIATKNDIDSYMVKQYQQLDQLEKRLTNGLINNQESEKEAHTSTNKTFKDNFITSLKNELDRANNGFLNDFENDAYKSGIIKALSIFNMLAYDKEVLAIEPFLKGELKREYEKDL